MFTHRGGRGSGGQASSIVFPKASISHRGRKGLPDCHKHVLPGGERRPASRAGGGNVSCLTPSHEDTKITPWASGSRLSIGGSQDGSWRPHNVVDWPPLPPGRLPGALPPARRALQLGEGPGAGSPRLNLPPACPMWLADVRSGCRERAPRRVERSQPRVDGSAGQIIHCQAAPSICAWTRFPGDGSPSLQASEPFPPFVASWLRVRTIPNARHHPAVACLPGPTKWEKSLIS
jgi:hypothetical protein